jgi:hypothetical protein
LSDAYFIGRKILLIMQIKKLFIGKGCDIYKRAITTFNYLPLAFFFDKITLFAATDMALPIKYTQGYSLV